jgi:hypothetical protein
MPYNRLKIKKGHFIRTRVKAGFKIAPDDAREIYHNTNVLL